MRFPNILNNVDRETFAISMNKLSTLFSAQVNILQKFLNFDFFHHDPPILTWFFPGEHDMYNVTVVISPGNYGGKENCDLTVNGTVAFLKANNESGEVEIDCKGESRHISYQFHDVNVTGFLVLGIEQIHFMNGNAATQNGGCVNIENTIPNLILEIRGNTFTGCQAANGGAIYLNSEGKYGGEIHDCKFSNNSATENGGAIYLHQYSQQGISFQENEFRNNHASHNGGALYVARGFQLFSDNLLEGNSAGHAGGAAYISTRATMMQNLNFEKNSAEIGGGICFDSSDRALDIIINNSTFTANTASHKGAAVFVGMLKNETTPNPIGITIRAHIQENVANNNGAAVYVEAKAVDSSFYSTTGFIQNNQGGGLILDTEGAGPDFSGFHYW